MIKSIDSEKNAIMKYPKYFNGFGKPFISTLVGYPSILLRCSIASLMGFLSDMLALLDIDTSSYLIFNIFPENSFLN